MSDDARRMFEAMGIVVYDITTDELQPIGGSMTLEKDIRQAAEELDMIRPPYREETLPTAVEIEADAVTQNGLLGEALTELRKKEEGYLLAIKTANEVIADLRTMLDEKEQAIVELGHVKMSAELLRQESTQVQGDLAKVAGELGDAMFHLRGIERLGSVDSSGMSAAMYLLATEARAHVQRAIASTNDARDVDIPF